MGNCLFRAAVLFEASFFWYEHIFSPVGAFQHVTGTFRAFAPLISPLVHRPGCLWRAVRGVQLAGGHNAFEAGLVLIPGALAALVFAPDRSIPRDGGDGLSRRVLPTIGRVYGLPRCARVLGSPCARLPSRGPCEDPSQRQGCELVKRPPCLVGKPQRTFPQIKEHFGAIRPNSLMMRRFIRAGLRLAYTTTRQIVRSRGLLVGLRSMCCSSSPRMPAAPRGRSFCIGVLSLGVHARSRVS